MGPFLDTLKSFGPARLAIMGGVVVGLIGFFIFLTAKLAQPQMGLLYSELDPNDSAQIVKRLEQSATPFEIAKGGTEIHVPGDRVARTRLTMAEQGLPAGGSIGYEVFDKTETLGSTNFVQNLNLVRALEGELTRTIKAINNVKSARVHLVLPKRELFSREREKASASIVLKMASAQRLNREQVMAIQHLVAAAVPGLSPQQISIVDDRGNLLARSDGGPAQIAQDIEDRRIAYEARLARTVEELLEKSVGFGKVRAEVRADIDFDKVSTTEERYDPEGQVVRSTQTIDEKANSKDSESDMPTSVGTNLPDGNDQGAAARSQSNESRTEETVNYEISKRVVNSVRETGLIRRLSVAVLVDGAYEKAGDARNYKPRDDKEMERLATLVRSAIGFNQQRGDVVEVVNLPFVEAAEAEGPGLDLFFGFTKQDLMRMAEVLVLSIVALLVILLVVRPLISRAFEALPGAAAAAGAMGAEGRLLADQGMGTPALAGPGMPGMPMAPEGLPPGEEEGLDDMINLDRVEGRVKASSVKKVGEIVEKHPEEALAIIRNWMYQET